MCSSGLAKKFERGIASLTGVVRLAGAKVGTQAGAGGQGGRDIGIARRYIEALVCKVYKRYRCARYARCTVCNVYAVHGVQVV